MIIALDQCFYEFWVPAISWFPASEKTDTRSETIPDLPSLGQVGLASGVLPPAMIVVAKTLF